ncbi:MAG TPA: DUF58 domain-containing protein [Terriglobales bacterium]|nr:DUF58 domain-containing protein [Terriglobales bacterium]
MQDASTRERTFLGRIFRVHISEVWMRFLLAIVGLVLAFAAALFSTVSRESGDLWATLILASLALLIAAVVGLTTVRYLARRVAVAAVRDSFDYDVTRVGIVYVLVAIVIGIAALNTGNNLLYIIVSAMLGAIFLSGVASAMVLRGLDLDVRLPEHVFAGRPIAARIMLHNRRWSPSFSVSVVPPKKRKAGKQWGWKETTFSFPAGRPPERQWLHLPDRELRRVPTAAAPPSIFDGSVYFPYIAGRSEVSADLELQFDRRGRYQQDSFGLSTRFPFSFLVKTRVMPLAREVIVYPSLETPDEFFEVLPLITGEFESFVRGRGYDLYRIRDYMPEDSARHVDWKSTAKSGSPKVREFTREDERKLRLVFDNPVPSAISHEAYESAVSLAASLAWHFSAEEDTDMSFSSQGFNARDLYQFLGFLALVEPQTAPSVVDELRPSDDYNIIITTRPRGTVPTALWACSYFVFLKD